MLLEIRTAPGYLEQCLVIQRRPEGTLLSRFSGSGSGGIRSGQSPEE